MKSGFFVPIVALVAACGLAERGLAQTNYFFRTPASEAAPDEFTLPAPAGPDGNYNLDDNWFDPNVVQRFIPDYSVGNGDRAFIENGGTAIVDSVVSISPGQLVMGSAGGTIGTVEVRSGGALASRVGLMTNGNITVGSTGGIGTARVLPGGTLTAEGNLAQGSNSANLIQVGGLTGATATLSVNSAVLPSRVQLFPNAVFTTTGGATLTASATYTSEITGNGANGKIDVGTSAALGGALVLNFNSYAPSVGHNWNVVEATAVNGNFASFTTNATLASNQNFIVTKPAAGAQIAYNVSLQEVLVLQVNRDTGTATLKHPGSAAILTDGYFIGSNSGSLVPANWNSFDAGNLFGGDWVATAATANNLGELKPTNDATLPGGNTLNYQFGAVFDPLAGPFGTVNEDLEFVYRRSSDGTQFPGRVEYSGTKFNTLLLQVDPAGSGNAFLRNTSDTTVQIDSYDVLSTAGRLTTTGWNSFDEQNYEGSGTWLELASNANQIGEVNTAGFTTLAPGASLNLGPLYLGGTQDLQLSYLLMGQENADSGKVLYQALAAVAGDYNGDGRVNAADYTVWRNTLGSTTQLQANGDNTGASAGRIDTADYNFWKARFGSISGAGGGGVGGIAAPEPTTWLLATLTAFGLCLTGRRGR